MGKYSILGILISWLPALFLCIYIYFKDRVEKEPISLLSILFGAGVLSYLPTLFCERKITGWFDMLFKEEIQHTTTGIAIFESDSYQFLHNGLCAFIGIALLEESVKWIFLFLLTRKNKNFDCLFDGIVYSVFLSLGFSAIESIHFAIVDGWDTLILRALTSIPTHILFGIITGMFYTIWHTLYVAKKEELSLYNDKLIKTKRIKYTFIWLLLSYFVPTIVHGLYCFAKLSSDSGLEYMYYTLIVILYIVCFAVVYIFSKYDNENAVLSKKILFHRHPELYKKIEEIK